MTQEQFSWQEPSLERNETASTSRSLREFIRKNVIRFGKNNFIMYMQNVIAFVNIHKIIKIYEYE